MSKAWFRFPLALLAFEPNDPSATLDAILDYCLWTVGNSEAAREISSANAYKYAREKNIFSRKHVQHLQLIRGAKILGVTGGSCDQMYRTVESVTTYLSPAGSATKNKLSINNEFFWRALHTARGDAAEKDQQELSWHYLRVLCALLSKIGSRKFDRCGWQEIQARAAGWCGKADKRAATSEELNRRKPLILSENQIRRIRDEMEACRFFCRFKYRTGGRGNGGESWYSFSTKDRAELLGWITDKKHSIRAAIAEKRALDAALLAGIRTNN